MQRESLARSVVLVGVILLQGFAFAEDVSRPTVPDNLQISLVDRLNVFDKAWETVNKNFFDPKGGVLGATHYKLPNGFDLHVALMDYHTAKGVRLEGLGVIPDVTVDLTAKDFREDKDAVLDRVKQLLLP